MKTISLTQGQIALVDDDDYEFLSQWKWSASRSLKTWYAVRYKGGKVVLMHRVILGLVDGEEPDHRNHNGLDNQRSNLRRCTRTQNQQNRHGWLRTGSKKPSQFKGVYREGVRANGRLRASPWVAQIKTNGQKVRRYHSDEESAARAYDVLAKRFFGEFAYLNFS